MLFSLSPHNKTQEKKRTQEHSISTHKRKKRFLFFVTVRKIKNTADNTHTEHTLVTLVAERERGRIFENDRKLEKLKISLFLASCRDDEF